jgi:hypothetical protein
MNSTRINRLSNKKYQHKLSIKVRLSQNIIKNTKKDQKISGKKGKKHYQN